MNIFQQLTNHETWSEYFEYKKEHRHLTRFEEKDLTEYITNREYLEAVRKLFDADKLFDSDSSHELTWARWYFPVINTDETLRELDKYMQQWIRYLASGHHNKKSYEFTYEDMKKLGYISLVREWYK